MSVQKEVHLYCDNPNCEDTTAFADRSFETTTAVRARAKRDGWKHRNGVDRCPQCVKTGWKP